MQTLSNAQRKYLKKLAHHEKAIFQVGKNGISDTFIEQVDLALEKRELIKFHILQNSDEEVQEAAEQIAHAVDAFVVQVIGHTGILYRESMKERYQKISQEVKRVK